MMLDLCCSTLVTLRQQQWGRGGSHEGQQVSRPTGWQPSTTAVSTTYSDPTAQSTWPKVSVHGIDIAKRGAKPNDRRGGTHHTAARRLGFPSESLIWNGGRLLAVSCPLPYPKWCVCHPPYARHGVCARVAVHSCHPPAGALSHPSFT